MKFQLIFAIAAMAVGTSEAVRLTGKPDSDTGKPIPNCNSACVNSVFMENLLPLGVRHCR